MTEAAASPPAIQEALETIKLARAELARSVVGMGGEINMLLCAILANRHVLVEGVPGIGKTHLVNTLSNIMGCTFKRIQFTPDLLPSDILGSFVFDARTSEFRLHRGPIFANVILADEINRAPAKTQSAMLEVMQERQVTIEGQTIQMERPFFVFATQNPLEHEGVYPLPQAQLDRFAMRLLPQYPKAVDEQRILALHRAPLPAVNPVLSGEAILQLQAGLEQVTVSDRILSLVVRLCARTRTYGEVMLGASPRLGIDLVHLARARAVLDDRAHVLPDDIKFLMHAVGNHRIMLTPQAEIGGTTVESIIDDAIQSTKLV